MTYLEFINNILETRGRFGCGEVYHERHHIKPKCLNGNNDENNLVDLFPREHFIAHKLLAEENPDNHSLVASYWCMAYLRKNNEEKNPCTPEEYEEARLAFIASQQGHPVSQDTRNKISNIRKGHEVSQETRDKISKSLTGHKLTNETKKKLSEISKRNFTPEMREKLIKANTGRHFSEEAKKKLSESKKGKKFSQEHIEKLRIAHKGKPSPNKGKHLTDEQKLKISKPVEQYDLDDNFIKRWDSATIAMQELKIHKSNITACCKGKRKWAGGFKWKYAK